VRIGYLRTSTQLQNLDLQRRALAAAGCEQFFEDQVSGASTSRPGLDAALAALQSGSVLTVWRLDRLGRSLPHLIHLVNDINGKGAGLHSLTEAIDTTSAGGRLVFHIMGALAEFERGLIIERTVAGMNAAKARHVLMGRRPGLTPTQVEMARVLLSKGESPSVVARTLRVGRSTLYRHLRRDDEQEG
jgi:DNA invertase Pin-like site-specific DNA recombinase